MTALLALSVLLASCKERQKGAETNSSGGAPLRKVRVLMQPHVSYAPLMIAFDEGFFRDEGLDVEPVTSIQNDETLVALVSGDLDVRPGPLSSGFLAAVAQGAKIRVERSKWDLERFGVLSETEY